MHSERSRRVVNERGDRSARGAHRARSDPHGGVPGRRAGRCSLGALGQLPVTVRFWDGSAVVAREDPDAPVVLLRDEQRDRALPARAQPARARPGVGVGRAGRRRRSRARARPAPARRRPRARAPRSRPAGGRGHAHRRAPRPAAAADPRDRGRAGRAPALAATGPGAVRHHYDVSNRFYELLLGPSLVYSCAYFATPDDSLEAAQERKLELICRKLRLAAGRAPARHRLRLGLAASCTRPRATACARSA